MNPLTKLRTGATKARSSAAGAGGRVRSAAGGAGSRVRDGLGATWSRTGGEIGRGWQWALGGLADAASRSRDAIADAADDAWQHSGGARTAAAARSNPRVAIAWAVAVLLLIGWLAWTTYVTAEHGANAGLGVLLSWPVVFAALALIAAPFVGAALIVRRIRGGEDTPPIAGGADVSTDSEAMTGGTYPG